MLGEKCYYADSIVCNGPLWECNTCGESYCLMHGHQTSQGTNVECVACEHARKQRISIGEATAFNSVYGAIQVLLRQKFGPDISELEEEEADISEDRSNITRKLSFRVNAMKYNIEMHALHEEE